MRLLVWAAGIAALGACAGDIPGRLDYRIAGDAIPEPLAAAPGDPARGRGVIMGRDGNCLLCHAVPGTGKRIMGDLGPPLAGVGARLTAGQLRLRVADSQRLNPQSIMPSYYRVDGLNEVAKNWRGKPVLTAQEVEDTVAFLVTLR